MFALKLTAVPFPPPLIAYMLQHVRRVIEELQQQEGTLKRLVILNKIGSGGFGVVHKGECWGAELLPLTLSWSYCHSLFHGATATPSFMELLLLTFTFEGWSGAKGVGLSSWCPGAAGGGCG